MNDFSNIFLPRKNVFPENPNDGVVFDEKNLSKIWLAGGCFWGVQAYFSRVYGVAATLAGYANGRTQNPTYKEIPHSGHAETVCVKYDVTKVDLQTLLKHLFKIIDPTSKNRQGNDIGEQYRTSIFYKDERDKDIAMEFIKAQQKNYSREIAVEVKPLLNFYPAEQKHQDYLEKNPGGYCHVDFSSLNFGAQDGEYKKPGDKELKTALTGLQYMVTQENETEPPFSNEYWDNDKKGIYVDIVTKQPLFLSNDKFHSDCGWPSFSKPIDDKLIKKTPDYSHTMKRIEVKSQLGDTHLGHLFDDGPKESGSLRYCINSASLRFVPIEKMKEEGYEKYISMIK